MTGGFSWGCGAPVRKPTLPSTSSRALWITVSESVQLGTVLLAPSLHLLLFSVFETLTEERREISHRTVFEFDYVASVRFHEEVDDDCFLAYLDGCPLLTTVSKGGVVALAPR